MSPILAFSALDEMLNAVLLTYEIVPILWLHLDENVSPITAAFCIQ
jgi:hypothetical protein